MMDYQGRQTEFERKFFNLKPLKTPYNDILPRMYI